MVGYAGSATYTAYVDMILTRSNHGAFELPTTSEAVHAGGDDRSPLAGLSGFYYYYYHYCFMATIQNNLPTCISQNPQLRTGGFC